MAKKVALIPVDARPVTYDLPKDLASLAGWELLLPAKEKIGFLKTPADYDYLFQWVDEIAPQVDGVIVSIDMILYGGLVPSRINTDDQSTIQDRLDRFLDIKRKYPQLDMMAFSSTMRLSNSYVNQEEKEYWDQYGKEIWQYSYHYHRYQQHGLKEDEAIVESMKEKIPHAILEDYLKTRERNFTVNMSLINYVADGVLDHLVFPQDDTSEYGLNIIEQQQLRDRLFAKNLQENIFIYPGADEVASVLVAHMIYQLENVTYPTFYPIYSGQRGALAIALYEDRPLQESVKGQIDAFGSHTVESIEDADIVLGINVPGRKQGDVSLRKQLSEIDTNDRNIGEWVKKLSYYYKKRKQVAIADVAYANGADPMMIPYVLQQFSLTELAGFAAWNTAGNTIGTVIAQAALVHLANQQGHDFSKAKNKQLVLRLLDDYLYQTVVRQEVREVMDEPSVTEGELLRKVEELFMTRAVEMVRKIDSNIQLESIYLPWNRTFEIGITLK
ncbi:DUF4127 family protein [Aquibacillus sp. 3ASR75-11]|uniref:DUF4127 family protein n=1 Tax=Terrihalobacillus insolitus TaxID=2950438 RepID=A0A9X3WR47_9BACI|nr:DUF4127 family protein [Terrihalobacillus insolitus]MDC3413811.1 DUF4127 family protein [Terrihalobacillus insolitus]MDC3424542.1 DUF4127 family protein [Terrihalobacillus insolitus]